MTQVAIGIDIGGTKIAGALVDQDGALRHEEIVATPQSRHGADSGSTETIALLKRLETEAEQAECRVLRVGIGVPEYVAPDGQINSSLVLASHSQLPTTTTKGVPVVFDSDVRCAARAESELGRGRTLSSFLFVSIGTGISHTLVIAGRIWTGARGEAIALGELPVDRSIAIRPDAPLTVEEQASGRAIEQVLSSRSAPDDAHQTLEDVSAQAGRIVAQALATAVYLIDPAAVIIGGGLGTSEGPFNEALVHNYSHSTRRASAPPLLRAELGEHAGVIGAGLLAHQSP